LTSDQNNLVEVVELGFVPKKEKSKKWMSVEDFIARALQLSFQGTSSHTNICTTE